MSLRWQSLVLSRSELRLERTLPTGQAFRWKRTESPKGMLWTGTIGQRVFTLMQTDCTLCYHVHNPTTEIEDKQSLTDYFQLDKNLSVLYSKWSKDDPNFRQKASSYEGVRLLRQDPLEALIAFICSSNNNIPRITLMMNRMCRKLGQQLAAFDGEHYYSLPTLETLAKKETEEELRALGFGYRAKYVHQTASELLERYGGVEWLVAMRTRPYREVWNELQQLPGVGGKVADCVCLMSLDKMEAVPVDTHVWQIAVRDYRFKAGGRKTLTGKMYQEIGDLFRSRFGDCAGWAQAVLFAADLNWDSSVVTMETKGTRKRPRSGETSDETVKRKITQ